MSTPTTLDQLVGLVEAATSAAVQQSFIKTVLPTYRPASVIAVNTGTWIHDIQMDGDAGTIQAHDLTGSGAFVGARVTVLFAPPHQAMIVAVNRRQTCWQTWPVDWNTNGGAPSIGSGTLIGAYQRQGFSCDVNLWLQFAGDTSGGTLGWSFDLPLPAAADVGEQIMPCKAFTTGGANWAGYAYISPGAQLITPFFPFNSGVSFLGQAQNADGGGGAGTGIPLVAGQYSWTNGTNFVITGRYKVA